MCPNCSLLQDDILTSTLTVKENVYLSASLRLPSEMKQQEKKEKVDEVIEELGLSHVANTLVPAYCLVPSLSLTILLALMLWIVHEK